MLREASTACPRVLQSFYSSIERHLGGDGAEAVAAALYELSQMQWRPAASKIAVLITDAPPHVWSTFRTVYIMVSDGKSVFQGIGEYGDGFPAGSPDGHDPLQLTRQMAAQGITLV
jgi:hypothetical protein